MVQSTNVYGMIQNGPKFFQMLPDILKLFLSPQPQTPLPPPLPPPPPPTPSLLPPPPPQQKLLKEIQHCKPYQKVFKILKKGGKYKKLPNNCQKQKENSNTQNNAS